MNTEHTTSSDASASGAQGVAGWILAPRFPLSPCLAHVDDRSTKWARGEGTHPGDLEPIGRV
jgi:hypothetical protein